MKRPETFPFEYQAGNLVFQIYLAPVAQKQKDGTRKKYDSFLIYHPKQGKEPIRRGNWEKVEAYIEDVVAAARANDPERLELTGRDRRVYLAAAELAGGIGMDVDAAVREYVEIDKIVKPLGITPHVGAHILADALKRCKGTPLSTVFDFFDRHGAKLTVRNTPDVVEELIIELKKNRRGDYHIRDTKNRLKRFAQSFTGPIHEVHEREISGWLQCLVKLEWEEGKRVPNEKGILVDDRTRNNYRDAVCELFAFARRRGYLLKGFDTEASLTERLEVISGKNHILSPAHARKGLEALSPHLVPFTVLKLFKGVRTEEGHAITWEDVKLKAKTLIVEAEISKLGQRRASSFTKNALKWLKPFADLTGPVNPRYSSPHSLQKAVKREFAKAGVVLKRNTFRNSYISYRLAQPTDSGIVADEAGTSKRMVEQNYKALATEAEGKEWFSIAPSRKKIAELKKYVAEFKAQKTEKEA